MINKPFYRSRLGLAVLGICLGLGVTQDAEAQVCGTLSLPGGTSNAIQATYDGAGEQLSSFFTGLNYGHRFGAPTSWLTSSTVQVGGAVLGADEAMQYRLSGTYSVAATGIAGSTLAVCLTSGLDYRRDNWRNEDLRFSYLDIPLVATLSAPLRFSDRTTISPFVAPAVHAYTADISGTYLAGVPDGWTFESIEVTEDGFDFSASLGASLMVARFSVIGAYQTGYMMFGDLDRVIMRLGYHF